MRVVIPTAPPKEVRRGELRERMQHAVGVRGMSPRTQEAYLAAVKGVAQHDRQRPDTLSAPQVEGYVRHLSEPRHLAPNSVRVAVCGVRFFSTVTLKRPAFALPLPKGVTKLPAVVSREEGGRLLSRTATLRERALVMTRSSPPIPVNKSGSRRGTSPGWGFGG